MRKSEWCASYACTGPPRLVGVFILGLGGGAGTGAEMDSEAAAGGAEGAGAVVVEAGVT